MLVFASRKLSVNVSVKKCFKNLLFWSLGHPPHVDFRIMDFKYCKTKDEMKADALTTLYASKSIHNSRHADWKGFWNVYQIMLFPFSDVWISYTLQISLHEAK